jgi:3-oxoacyl-[acyl-carrier protein] reductase
MDLGLKNKVAFVAGSSRGIGRAVARGFLAEGARVVLTGRDQKVLETALREFQEQFGDGAVFSVAGDLTDQSVIKASVQQVRAHWGDIDCVVANIGSGKSVPGWRIDPAEWDRVFDVNLFGSFALVNEVLPHLVEKKSGCVVLISSITGVEATHAPLAYSSAKAALNNYAKNLARQVAPHGVRVNCVAPGNIFFPGGTWEEHLEKSRDKVMHYLESEVPMARFGRPEEIADVVVFLCSERASFATGLCAVVDGGQTRGV